MADIEQRVREILAEVLGNGTTAESLRPDGNLIEEYGLDSLQAISFLLRIEDAFDIQLDYENLDLDDLRSIRRFVTYVETMLVGSP